MVGFCVLFFFFSSRRRHTRYWRDWSDVCSSDLRVGREALPGAERRRARLRRGGLGPERALRLGPPDLDDPLPRRKGAVERRAPPVVRPERPPDRTSVV